MAFRDDRDALRARTEAAERDARELERKLEEVQRALDAHEQKDVRDEAEIGRLRNELTKLQPKGSATSRFGPGRVTNGPVMMLTAIAVAVILMIGAVGFRMLRSSTHVKRDDTAVAAAEPAAKPSAPTPAGPLDAALFGAQVVSDEGDSLGEGEGCVVEADLARGLNVRRLRVFCGAQPVYDSTQTGGAEMTTRSENVQEWQLGSQTFVYGLHYADTGTRTGPRPQAALDAERHTARIWSDGAAPSDLRLFLDDQSAPRQGDALGSPEEESTLEPMHVRAVATQRRGPVPSGIATCELIAHAETGSFSCRFALRCGNTLPYGSGTTGFNHCTAALDGTIASADDTRDDDGDPRFRFDGAGHRLEVATADWRAQLRIEEDPRCNLDGRWAGRARTADGESRVTLAPPSSGAAPALQAESLPSGPAQVHLDCVRGTGELELEDGTRYHGVFGPGFATFLGYCEGDTPALFWLRREPPAD